MGTKARLTVYAKDRDAADEAARAAYHRVTELELIGSDYRKDSELMQLCAKAGGPPVKVSEDLFIQVSKAQEIAKRSGGALDITCGPIIQLWRQARKTGQLPTTRQVEDARRQAGWQKVKLDPANRTIQLEVPGMRLDLGGIGKGYAGDCVMETLRGFGVRSAYFEMGGEIVVSDAPPDDPAGWRIGLPPEEGSDKERIVTLSNCAVSTSGDTMQFVIIGGKQYSHVIDPRTGCALTSRRMTTIIAPKGVLADALSTATSVLEPGDARKLAEQCPGVKLNIRTATADENRKTQEW